MKNYNKKLLVHLCFATLMVAPPEKIKIDTKRADSVSFDEFTPVGSRQNSFDVHGLSDSDRTDTDSTDASTEVDSPLDMGLFTSKQRLLKQINLYLKYELGLSDPSVKSEMKSLRKLSISQLRQRYENNHEFIQREDVLRLS